jgi:hypothetical protein
VPLILKLFSRKHVLTRSEGNTHLDIPEYHPRASGTGAIHGSGVSFAICDRTAYDKGGPIVSRGIAHGADFLLGRSKEDGGLDEVLLGWA